MRTHNKPVQPASHHCSHTCKASTPFMFYFLGGHGCWVKRSGGLENKCGTVWLCMETVHAVVAPGHSSVLTVCGQVAACAG